jgi:hypothetical protein
LENCSYVQLDRLVKEFIVPLEKQIRSEQKEKQVVEKEKETQEIVGQKRRARSCTGTSGTSTRSASTEMVAAAGGTRRRKRAKVAPTRCAPVVEDESLEASPLDSSGVVIRNTTLAASPPLENSIATDETTMNGSNEDTNTDSSQRVSAVQPLQWFIIEEAFARHLMSASKILWRSKQSLDTAMCLKQTQETISTILWGYGAVISGVLIRLSKREEFRDVNFPKLT